MQNPKDLSVSIQGPSGQIEALLTDANHAKSLAIICHPHPLHGGSMHNKVVHTITRACHRQGIISLRFNYRGVGKSAGSYGNYAGELQDAIAIKDWLKENYPGYNIIAAGFSFGAYIATALSTKEKVQQLITIAPAINNKSYDEVQKLVTCPWHVIQGTKDEIVPPDAIYNWQKKIAHKNKLHLIENAGHFFHGKLIELRELIEKILQNPSY